MSSVVVKTISKDDQLSYEREVDRIVLTQGKILVNDRGEDTILKGEDTYEAKGSSAITITALEASHVTIEFPADTVIVNPEPLRGELKRDLADSLDFGELQRLARERQIEGYGNLSRADLIASLGGA